MLPGGRWQDVSDSERAEHSASFARMEKPFDEHEVVDDMGQHARLTLLDAQNDVNVILPTTTAIA
ncbi:MAG TPA: hypothetical protein VFK00_11415 [Rhodanobacteraceae bacterium]|jgi:hypothetical protein|nr:hypothetical protein [Rhodanobacteraceae bacterium]